MANADYIIIQNNKIDMVNSDAKDIGVYLDSDTRYCVVSGYAISNAGIQVQDLGTGNTIGISGGTS